MVNLFPELEIDFVAPAAYEDVLPGDADMFIPQAQLPDYYDYRAVTFGEECEMLPPVDDQWRPCLWISIALLVLQVLFVSHRRLRPVA